MSSYPDLVVAYVIDARQRWLPTWWAVRLLVEAGARPDHARVAVNQAVTAVGRRIASRRVLPVWAVRVMADELRADLDER